MDHGEPPGRNTTDDSNDSPDLQDIQTHWSKKPPANCRCRVQAKAEEKGRQALQNPGGQQATSEDGRQLQTLGQTMLKVLHVLELMRCHTEGGSTEGGGSRKAETGAGPVHLSAVPQKDTTGHGNFDVPLDSPDPEKEELFRELMEENQRTAELTGQITHLQAEEVSLHIEHAQLESEGQKLQLKLQIPPEVCEDHVL